MALREMIRSLGVPADERPAFRRRVRALSAEGVLVRVRSRYALPASLSIQRGMFRGHREGYGFIIIEEIEKRGKKKEPDIFIKRGRTSGAMDGDLVVVRVERTGPDGRHEGSVVEILERAHTTLVGRLAADRRRAWVEPHEQRIPDIVLIAPSMRGGARTGEWVEVELESYPGPRREARGKIVRSFGYPDNPAVEQKMIIAKAGIRESFSEVALKESEALKPPTEDEPFLRGVEDLRDLEVFTIDPRTAHDRDDALSIETLRGGIRRLGVHIADVSHYVRTGSEVDMEAALRGNSVYFPDRAIPMLPPHLSSHVCSLEEGEIRRTLSAFLDFDAKGRRVSLRLTVARIRSCASLAYAAAGAVLEERDIPDRDEFERALALRVPLSELAVLAGQLRSRRVTEGSLDFELPEARVVLDKMGRPLSVDRAPRYVSHRLVEECMLAANRAVAEKLADEAGAAIYRVHPPPAEESVEAVRQVLDRLGLASSPAQALLSGPGLQAVLKAVAGRDTERYVNLLVLRSMKLALYEAEPGRHFGLGFDPYTHFTSPIRRYADLIVHRCLKRLIRGDRRKASPARLAKACAQISERERSTQTAEREMVNFLKALLMKERIGESCTGHVSGVTGFGVFVELDENFVEGMVPLEVLTDDYYHYLPEEQAVLGEQTGRRIRLGDPVTVRVLASDLARREVTFQLLVGGGCEFPQRATATRRRARTMGRSRPLLASRGDSAPSRKPKPERKKAPRKKRQRSR